jgi:glycosyltransferase involved in cell wall biosynthesis
LRVAFDATPLLDRPTGVGVFCRGALSALAKRQDVDPAAYYVTWRGRPGPDTAVAPAWPQRPMPAAALHVAWRLSSVPPFEWFVRGAGVVHGTNFVVPPARRAAQVVTVHDMTPVKFPHLCSRAVRAFPALLRGALRRGAWVHAVSQFVADEVIEVFGADPARVRVVHHGVPAVPEIGTDDVARGVGDVLPAGVPYVLAVGTAEPRKDLPTLVDAFDRVAAAHPGVHLVLAGPPGPGEDALSAALGGAAARSRVVRTGWVDDRTLASLYRSAAVLAYPSIYEGFGFPPLQAMQAGVPVVATRTGAIPEVVGDAALLVQVGDAAGLADALSRVLSDEGERDRLVQAGRARTGLFSWDACAAGLSDLYRAAAGGIR